MTNVNICEYMTKYVNPSNDHGDDIDEEDE